MSIFFILEKQLADASIGLLLFSLPFIFSGFVAAALPSLHRYFVIIWCEVAFKEPHSLFVKQQFKISFHFSDTLFTCWRIFSDFSKDTKLQRALFTRHHPNQ